MGVTHTERLFVLHTCTLNMQARIVACPCPAMPHQLAAGPPLPPAAAATGKPPVTALCWMLCVMVSTPIAPHRHPSNTAHLAPGEISASYDYTVAEGFEHGLFAYYLLRVGAGRTCGALQQTGQHLW